MTSALCVFRNQARSDFETSLLSWYSAREVPRISRTMWRTVEPVVVARSSFAFSHTGIRGRIPNTRHMCCGVARSSTACPVPAFGGM